MSFITTAFKEEIDRKFPPNRRGKNKPYTNNTSGVKGLRLQWDEMKSGYAYPYICVNYTDNGGIKRGASYSVNKHGLKEALRLAMKKRTDHGHLVPSLKKCIEIFSPQLRTS